MPVVGKPVRVRVVVLPFGTMLTLSNRAGSRRTFRFAGQVLFVDGNTTVGAVAEVPPDELVVMTDQDGQVWPDPELG